MGYLYKLLYIFLYTCILRIQTCIHKLWQYVIVSTIIRVS